MVNLGTYPTPQGTHMGLILGLEPRPQHCATLALQLGPVVQMPVSANPGLNFNPGFFFYLPKALSRIIFSILFRVSNHQIVSQDN